MKLEHLSFDPDIIPNEKERLFKEAFELFRRACNLNDSIHMLELAHTPSERLKAIYTTAIMELEQQRDKIMEDAIVRYQKSKGK